MRENVVSKVCNFSRFVADRAFHTCAALGCGRIATPTVLVTFATKSNASAAWQKICTRTKAKILRLVSLAQNDRISLCVFITGRRGRRPLRGYTKTYLFAKFKFFHRYKILLFYLSVIFPYKRGGYCFFCEN